MQLEIIFLFVTAGIVQMSSGQSIWEEELREGAFCSAEEQKFKGEADLPWHSQHLAPSGKGTGCQNKGLLQREQFILQAIQVHP